MGSLTPHAQNTHTYRHTYKKQIKNRIEGKNKIVDEIIIIVITIIVMIIISEAKQNVEEMRLLFLLVCQSVNFLPLVPPS